MSETFFFFRLSNVTLETAIFISGSKNNLAIGVEVCQCPEMYEGSSCQNPADGYYRYRETIVATSNLHYDNYIGKSMPCECNGRSNQCDKDTGYCKVRKLLVKLKLDKKKNFETFCVPGIVRKFFFHHKFFPKKKYFRNFFSNIYLKY